ncbi:Uncharacterised protein [Burkholderia pseudomallei]|nr:Uncharacterised protein [Burkholderia pseudomallei]
MRVVDVDAHVGGRCVRMFGNVCERFLRDPENGERAVGGQLRDARVGRADEARAQAGARAVRADPRGERADKPRLERGRAQPVDQAAVRGRGGVERLLRERERTPGGVGRVVGQPRFDVREREARGGEIGAEAVVKLAREMAARGFVGGDELGGQLRDARAEPLGGGRARGAAGNERNADLGREAARRRSGGACNRRRNRRRIHDSPFLFRKLFRHLLKRLPIHADGRICRRDVSHVLRKHYLHLVTFGPAL